VSDPTETHDLSAQEPERFAAMSKAMAAFEVSIQNSAVTESQCEQPGSGPKPGPAPAPAPPLPPMPPSGESKTAT
jgi:hypothetical protein